MITETRYQGWKNYETWLVKLWIDNDQASAEDWQARAKGEYEDAEADKVFTKLERAKLNLADDLKAEFEDNAPELQGCYADLLNAALSEVDWYEIAENVLAEIEVEAKA